MGAQTGAAADASGEVPMGTGSTGVWIPQTTTLFHARSNSAGVVAPDGAGGLRVYLVGGWGSCTGAGPSGVMSCAEATSITALGDALGAAFAPAGLTGGTFLGDAGVLDAGAGTMTARMRHGLAALTSGNEPPDASVGAAFLVIGGGYGPGIGSGAVEYAAIASSAIALGPWTTANATFSEARDGTQIAIVNAEAYDFMGGTAPNQYKATGFLSSVSQVSSSTITFGSWSSNASALPGGAVLGRFGLSIESAYFYVVGGTSNDTDALTTVYQILY